MLDANTPVTITMEAIAWNNLLNILMEAGPFRIVSPLMDKIRQEMQTAESQSVGQTLQMPNKLNGGSSANMGASEPVRS